MLEIGYIPWQETGLLAGRPPRNRRVATRRSSDGRAQKAPTTEPRLLIVGSIRELGLYRAEYLRTKGFAVHVSAPPSADEVVATLKREGFHAVILSYTLPNYLVIELAELVRQACPKCALIVISNRDGADPRVMPDEVVVADLGPEALLSAVRRAVGMGVQ
jgi:hypothetical protein